MPPLEIPCLLTSSAPRSPSPTRSPSDASKEAGAFMSFSVVFFVEKITNHRPALRMSFCAVFCRKKSSQVRIRYDIVEEIRTQKPKENTVGSGKKEKKKQRNEEKQKHQNRIGT
jgi:hypothetical protein